VWARIPNLNCFSHNRSSVKPDLKYLLGTLLGTRIERHAREKLQTVRARKAKIKKRCAPKPRVAQRLGFPTLQSRAHKRVCRVANVCSKMTGVNPASF
jgi:hypothetical protein